MAAWRIVDGVPQRLVFGGVYLCVPGRSGALASHAFKSTYDRASAPFTTSAGSTYATKSARAKPRR